MTLKRNFTVLILSVLALGMAGCATSPGPEATAAPTVVPTLPPAFPPQDIVGRWGLAAYHKDEDRQRIEVAAAGQCKQPYVITLGPAGGVMMHLADQATPTELALKGAPGGKTYIGPKDEPPASSDDREVVSFDGRILILRWLDPEVQGRYGTMVYVRCGAEGTKSAKPKAKPKPKPAAAPKLVQPPVQQQKP
ncbi:MAG TPA: hypothetical protein VMI47_00555 [Pseudolabrys sp.]|nr:hypothetical protein [Pseudolabrys sp.]